MREKYTVYKGAATMLNYLEPIPLEPLPKAGRHEQDHYTHDHFSDVDRLRGASDHGDA